MVEVGRDVGRVHERSADGLGQIARWGRRAVGMSAVTLSLIALAVSPARAQNLEAYDYDNLRLRGATGEVFLVFPRNVKETVGFGARVDVGFLGPSVRMQARAAYWGSELKDSEVRRFEDRIEELVEEQGGAAPPDGLDLGTIKRKSLLFGADLHWMPNASSIVRPYLGLGAEIYFLSGSGEAIDGTFVDESLDLFTAGVSAVAGLEFGLGSNIVFYGDARGALVADVRSIALTVGLGYIAP